MEGQSPSGRRHSSPGELGKQADESVGVIGRECQHHAGQFFQSRKNVGICLFLHRTTSSTCIAPARTTADSYGSSAIVLRLRQHQPRTSAGFLPGRAERTDRQH